MKAELHFLGIVIDLLYIDTVYAKDFSKYQGIPVFYNQGGLLYFEFPYGKAYEGLLERMLTINYELYKMGYPLDDGKIVFYNPIVDILKTWKFKDAFIKHYKVKFDPNGIGIKVEMIISPAIQNYGCKIHRSWHITPIEEETYQSPVYAVEEKDKKPFRININAKSSDIKNGIFGFDKIPDNYKNICVSDVEKLRKEYKPINDILGKEYLPPWLSFRKGQTVELEIDWEKKGRVDDYTNIAFDTHPDFTITPTNLKGASKIQITCKNTNQTPYQLLIKADNTTVGALNVFYPKPKTIDLEWYFVEITGNKTDNDELEKKINKTKLESLLKKGLNPALIDVTISNNSAKIIDVTEYTERLKQRGVLKKHIDIDIGNYIEFDKKQSFLGTISIKHKRNASVLTLYVINRKFINTKNIPTDGGAYPMSGGFSPTGTGLAYMALGDGNLIDSRNVMHEIMHSLGLEHTFLKKGESPTDFIHLFKKEKTKNYMDYKTTKLYTRKWQWKKLQQYSQLK